MKRLIYQSLINWKKSPSRKPLLFQGARQVGKTYLVSEFGKNEYSNFISFNFEEDTGLNSLFDKDLSPANLLDNLSAYRGVSIKPESTLIFFDEIQSCPRAVTSLKYFCEKAPEYHIIAAGSLLGVSLNKTSSFPVGKVNFMTLYPLNFHEFLIAAGEDSLVELLLNTDYNRALPDLFHEKLTLLLRKYMYIGGMPEAVRTYVELKDFQAVRLIQKDIIRSYERDFSKYSTPVQTMRVSELWHSLSSQLARENKKFKYSEVKKGSRAKDYDSAIEWLRSAGLIYQAFCVSTAKVPLKGYEDSSHFKAYLFDSGILGALLDIPSRMIVDGDAILSEFNGAFTENYVATELASTQEGVLHYWQSENVAEVDFVLENDGQIIPLEVKSGLNRRMNSLRIFEEKFKPGQLFRTSPRNYYSSEGFTNIPLYAVCSFSKKQQQ